MSENRSIIFKSNCLSKAVLQKIARQKNVTLERLIEDVLLDYQIEELLDSVPEDQLFYNFRELVKAPHRRFLEGN